jgi:hypothetical protein
MNMTSIFVLERSLGGKYDTEFVQADPVRLGVAPRCAVCGAATGMRPWLPPHRAELIVHGDGFGDVAYGPSASFLFSARLMDAYQAEKLRGLQGFEPVEIVRIQPKRLAGLAPTYVHVRATLSQAALDDSASGVTRTVDKPCPMCRSDGLGKVARVVLETETWGDEDVFEARGLPGVTLASPRFRAFVEHHRLTNVTLTPAEKYSMDFTRPAMNQLRSVRSDQGQI